ncbi:16S rRNA (guanine(966)-N(2))-methyltransferase RsmD [Phototrophicus methaneseepsis]|uniref:16S rRNA (Guanine(966)-N(2))-methyltransferase RsmD n=1 Tax=Phototrophicus methaneseepsis TaxID=2710758 RepID=A0A7S8E5E8_9CHLR|nr:16S rRNA (guanine(966)-N(2))-methyltransferase RsmD [Phototrophicus methaneseepsis]QPC80717.1 16S rRNA (guanine(966)-N(2))-methyltransferase RsmD [Phototrophicus methaneseepsis]
MPIRVIAGSAKGKRLKLVPGDSTRPIMDRVKEALFSILGSYVVGSKFLDLFAGTGSVGIEALSRGAEMALFNELDRKALQTIRENLQTTGLADQAEISMMDALSLIKRGPTQAFDYIYIAPPQYKGTWINVLRAIDETPAWINDETIIIVQIDPSEDETAYFDHIQEYDRRVYGSTLLIFYERVGTSG